MLLGTVYRPTFIQFHRGFLQGQSSAHLPPCLPPSLHVPFPLSSLICLQPRLPLSLAPEVPGGALTERVTCGEACRAGRALRAVLAGVTGF